MSEAGSPPLLAQRYQLSDLIGAGATSRVYRAFDRLTGEMVAIKAVAVRQGGREPGDMQGDDQTARRRELAREFKLLTALRHQHIIQVRDYGFDPAGQPFLALELLAEASTITAAGAALPLDERLELLSQALQALAYLHRRGVLHHDLKPGNVLVSGGSVRMLDFGLAVAGDGRRADDAFGTLAYLAPEVFEGAAFTAASDLYALGVVAYELLVGAHPFAAPGGAALLDRVLHDEPALTPLAPFPALAGLVGALLAKGPAGRPPSAEAALAELCAAMGRPLPVESTAARESLVANFVGREGELRELQAALARADAGEAGLWLIGGESGVGKSRLLEELRILAQVAGALVVRGQGVEGGGLPYQLWREPLRRLVLGSSLSDLEAGVLLGLVPDLGTLIGRTVADAPELDPGAARQRLAGAIAKLLAQQRQTVVMLLEDLQWVEESRELLAEVWPQVTGLPLLILGSYRNDESPRLPEQLPGARALRLERLGAAAIAELSAAMLGPLGERAEVVELFARESEGNAFLMVELGRALIAEGAPGASNGGPAWPPSLPGGQQLVQRRLARVPAMDQALLRLAAVAGRQLDLAMLQGAGGGSTLAAWLERCADCGVLEFADERWRFSHDKLREGVIAGLGAAERAALNRQVAMAIEALYAEPATRASFAEALSGHWRAAGEPARELDYLLTAIERATRYTASFEQARAWAARGRELAHSLPSPEREAMLMRLLLLGGFADHFNSSFEPAIEQFEAALALARSLGNEAVAVEALIQLADLRLTRGEIAAVLSSVDVALPLARHLGDRRLLAELLRIAGHAEANRLNMAASEGYLAESVALFRAIGDRRGEAWALNCQTIAAIQVNDWERERATAMQSLALLRQIGDRLGATIVLINMATSAARRGELATALGHQAEAAELARQINDRQIGAWARETAAICALAAGDYGGAVAAFDQCLALLRAIDDHVGIAEVMVKQSQALVALGELARAEEAIEAGRAVLAAADNRGSDSIVLLVAGELAMLRGDHDGAEAAWRACAEQASRLALVSALVSLGRLALARGSPAAALRTLGEAIELAQRAYGPVELVEARARLAQAQSAAGEQGVAWETLREAASGAAALGLEPRSLTVALAAAQLYGAAGAYGPASRLAGLVASHGRSTAGQRAEAQAIGAGLQRAMAPLAFSLAWGQGARQQLGKSVALLARGLEP